MTDPYPFNLTPDSPDEALLAAPIDEAAFHFQKNPRYGESNPERIALPFWTYMARRGFSAWEGRLRFDSAYQCYVAVLEANPINIPVDRPPNAAEIAAMEAMFEAVPRYDHGEPLWSFRRLGMSRTEMPDGRLIYIGGEHEDFYDLDFYIYNDVIVFQPDGAIQIYAYPRTLFIPTDFHSATVAGANAIYIIGNLGY